LQLEGKHEEVKVMKKLVDILKELEEQLSD